MARNTYIPGWTGNRISYILAPMQSTLARAAAVILAFLPGCTFNTEVQVESSADESGDPPGLDSTGDPDPGYTSTSNGSATGQIHTTGSMDTGSADSSTSGASSDGTTSTGAVDSTGSSTGDDRVCILPVEGSWCAAQREVAQAVGCRLASPPLAESCYRTIVAQYEVGDWEILAAGDCDPVVDGPDCADAYSLCTDDVTGHVACYLMDPILDDCQALALSDGITIEESALPCAWIIDAYN